MDSIDNLELGSTMDFLKILPIVVCSLLVSPIAQANVVAGDRDYKIIYDDDLRYVFPSNLDRNSLYDLIHLNKATHEFYKESYDWILDEDTAIVLAGPRNQVSNAFATVIPNNLTIFYPGGEGLLEQFAEMNWTEALIIHETAHLYQINAKSQFPGMVKTVLGNNLVIPVFFPFFVFTTPNVFLPTFIVEGNATLNESRFGVGGRLFSAPVRAVDFAVAKAGKLDETYILNEHYMFPYGQEKYSMGAQFFEFLSRSHDIDKLNRIFNEHGERWLNPFLLNESFRRHFGLSFDILFQRFKKEFEKKAAKHRSFEKGKVIARSNSFAGFGRSSDKIYFMSTNLRDEMQFHTLDRKSLKLNSQDGDWIFGTPYNWKGKLSTTGRFAHDGKEGLSFVAGLYREGAKLENSTKGKIVHDVLDDEILYYESKNAFNGDPELIKNGESLGVANSRAIFDETGNAYFFRQNGNTRSLFKNNRSLFQYEGFYGRVADVTKEHGILFVANSKLGSTLYRYHQDKITRVFSYDNILDARIVGPGKKSGRTKLIVTTVNEDGYAYRLVETKLERSKTRKPYVVRYDFQKSDSYTSIKEVMKKSERPSAGSLKEKSYGPIREMRFSSLLPTVSFITETDASSDEEETFTIASLAATFVDPLGQNALGLNYNYGPRNSHSLTAAYTNTEHRLNYTLGHNFIQDDEANDIFLYENTSFLLFDYNLSINGYWRQDLQLGLFYENTSSNIGLNKNEESFSVLGYNLGYSYGLGLGFSTMRRFNLGLEAYAFEETSVGSLSVFGQKDLGSENYVSLLVGGAYGDKPRVEVRNVSGVSFGFDQVSMSSLSTDVTEVLTQALHARLTFASAINWSYYFNYVPVGLRRFMPFVSVQHNSVGNTSDSTSDFYEPFEFSEFSVGATFDLLFLHKWPIPLTVSYGQNFLEEADQDRLDTSSIFMISTQQEF